VPITEDVIKKIADDTGKTSNMGRFDST